jgi:non-specific serine/threonine protein kinase
LAIGDASTQSPVERLLQFIGTRTALLVLDNFEQILAGAPVVSQLLAHCPELKVLVTSRAPLRLYGEHEFFVAPLAYPVDLATTSPERILESESVQLFLARAQAVRGDFQLTLKTASPVAEICHRLDGLPLAIELAAARTKVLSPEALLARLGDRLSLLTTGSLERPARQRTLRGALDWSHDLLPAPVKKLFRRLSIFNGGCTLSAARTVCDLDGDLEMDVLDGLAELVDWSLLQSDAEPDGEPRCRMLESIREYAWERLLSSPDFPVVRQRHAAVFPALAEAAGDQLHGPEQTKWRDRLQREMPNLRLALHWCLEHDHLAPGMRAASALWLFWFVRGFVTEGRQMLKLLLEHPMSGAGSARAQALFTAGMLAFYQHDVEAGRRLHEEGLAIQQGLGDWAGIATALFGLAQVEFDANELPKARALHEQALAIRRELGDPWQIAFSAGNLGLVLQQSGDSLRARELIEESIAIRRQMGDVRGTAGGLFVLARLVQDAGDLDGARSLYRESFALAKEADDRWTLGHILAGLASLAASEGRWTLALRLHSAAAMTSEASESTLFPGWRERVDLNVQQARRELDANAAAEAWDEGRQTDIEVLLTEVLSAPTPSSVPPNRALDAPKPVEGGLHASYAIPLTRREREIARLIALGLTNRQIAEALTISERTAATHIAHIFEKLEMNSRAQVASWAALRLDISSSEVRRNISRPDDATSRGSL